MLDFNRSSTAPQSGASRSDLPKATSWLNFGYTVEIGSGKDADTRFVSLPVGIPLDTMEPLAITSRNSEFAQFQAARNDVLSQIKSVADSMKPGEERIICVDATSGLAVQLRRVNDAVVAPAADASNPYAVKLAL